MNRDSASARGDAGLRLAYGDAGLPILPTGWPQLGDPGLGGRYRLRCEDFRVEELPGWTPDGDGEHLLLEVEKTGANTAFVARELARMAGVEEGDLGWCGAKDRHAVTRQWFSLRDPSERCGLSPGAAGEQGPGAADHGGHGEADSDGHGGIDSSWRVLAVARHRRKLRRGDHAGNRFRIRVELDAEPAGELLPWVRERLDAGFPNYFGPQRFGRGGSNLHAAERWVRDGRLPGRGAARGFLLSAARALLFNEVLAARLRAGSACSVLDGEALQQGEPAGPLWGRGRSRASGAAAELEAAALAPWQAWCARLEQVGLNQERRALWLRPQAATAALEGRSLVLAFELPPGAFATAVLAGIGRFRDAAAQMTSEQHLERA